MKVGFPFRALTLSSLSCLILLSDPAAALQKDENGFLKLSPRYRRADIARRKSIAENSPAYKNAMRKLRLKRMGSPHVRIDSDLNTIRKARPFPAEARLRTKHVRGYEADTGRSLVLGNRSDLVPLKSAPSETRIQRALRELADNGTKDIMNGKGEHVLDFLQGTTSLDPFPLAKTTLAFHRAHQKIQEFSREKLALQQNVRDLSARIQQIRADKAELQARIEDDEVYLGTCLRVTPSPNTRPLARVSDNTPGADKYNRARALLARNPNSKRAVVLLKHAAYKDRLPDAAYLLSFLQRKSLNSTAADQALIFAANLDSPPAGAGAIRRSPNYRFPTPVVAQEDLARRFAQRADIAAQTGDSKTALAYSQVASIYAAKASQQMYPPAIKTRMQLLAQARRGLYLSLRNAQQELSQKRKDLLRVNRALEAAKTDAQRALRP